MSFFINLKYYFIKGLKFLISPLIKKINSGYKIMSGFINSVSGQITKMSETEVNRRVHKNPNCC